MCVEQFASARSTAQAHVEASTGLHMKSSAQGNKLQDGRIDTCAVHGCNARDMARLG